MSFHLHLAEHHTPSRAPSHHWLSTCLVAGLAVLLAALLADAALTGGANVRKFHQAATELLRRI